jgi:hypothetical protein
MFGHRNECSAGRGVGSARWALFAMSVAAMLQGAAVADGLPPRHYLIGDYSAQRVVMYGDAEGIVWTSPRWAGVYDCCMRTNGNVLAAGYDGVVEWAVDPAGKTTRELWRYKAGSASGYAGRAETHSCEVLPDGSVLVAEGGMPRLVLLGQTGAVLRTIPVSTPNKDSHTQLRQARLFRNGTFLVGFDGEGVVREIAQTGATNRTFVLDPKGGVGGHRAYAGMASSDGKILASGAGLGCLIEFDADGRETWRLDPKDVPDAGMSWVAGFQVLEDGGLLVANWSGGNGRHRLFQVNRDKTVLWKLDDPKIVTGASSVVLLDDAWKPKRRGEGR